MGVFDFVKGAGRKEKAKQDEERNDLIRGNKLLRYVMGLGFDIEDLRVRYDDGVATVTGKAASQAVREKVVLALGNSEGVAQVDDRMEVGSPEAEAKFYTVQKGDSLSKIAKELYGDAMKYPAIFEANKPMLTDPNLIYPGQVLRIPPVG